MLLTGWRAWRWAASPLVVWRCRDEARAPWVVWPALVGRDRGKGGPLRGGQRWESGRGRGRSLAVAARFGRVLGGSTGGAGPIPCLMARSAGWAAGGGGRTGVRLVRFGASSALPVASAAGPGEVPEPPTLAALARRRDPFLHPHF